MSCSLHIIRQAGGGSDIPITLEEWNACIASDPEFKRPEPGHLNYSKNLVLLPDDSEDPDMWQWIKWGGGTISSDYPQQPMLKKMGRMARHLGAVLMSDDGDIWSIDENGRVSIDGG